MGLVCCSWSYLGFHSGSIEKPLLTEFLWVRSSIGIGVILPTLTNNLTKSISQPELFSGITTVLTMTFMGLEARKDLPKVTYPTALDYFVFISFMYIFSTVVQVFSGTS